MHFSSHIARANGVHPDTFFGHFLGEASREDIKATFGRGVMDRNTPGAPVLAAPEEILTMSPPCPPRVCGPSA